MTRLTPLQKTAAISLALALVAGCTRDAGLTCYGFCSLESATSIEGHNP